MRFLELSSFTMPLSSDVEPGIIPVSPIPGRVYNKVLFRFFKTIESSDSRCIRYDTGTFTIASCKVDLPGKLVNPSRLYRSSSRRYDSSSRYVFLCFFFSRSASTCGFAGCFGGLPIVDNSQGSGILFMISFALLMNHSSSCFIARSYIFQLVLNFRSGFSPSLLYCLHPI